MRKSDPLQRGENSARIFHVAPGTGALHVLQLKVPDVEWVRFMGELG